MNVEEFKKFIQSIGFEEMIGSYYRYKEFVIVLYNNEYSFYNASGWIGIYELNDLTPLKKITRDIKLKQLLR